MWVALAVTVAVAAADRPLVRAGQTAKPARYAKVTPGPPARARNKGGGAFLAWVWRDGVVEHYHQYDRRGALVETRQFDGHGEPVATVAWVDGAAARVVVHAGARDAELDVRTWTEAGLPTAAPVIRLRLPDTARTPDANGLDVALPGGGELRVRVLSGPSAVDSDAFRDGLAETCACVLIDRTTAFVDGRPGVRYLAERWDVHHPAIGELWAVSTPEATLFATWFVPGVSPEDLGGWARATASGRAAMTLARWAPR